MTVLYPNQCYNEVFYEGTTLYSFTTFQLNSKGFNQRCIDLST